MARSPATRGSAIRFNPCPVPAVILLLILLLTCGVSANDHHDSDGTDYIELLRPAEEPAAGGNFRRVLEARSFSFPADHASHPHYRLEWWYLTGHLMPETDPEHSGWGFQLTFFRLALRPEQESTAPRGWQSPQLYMAHFAITDIPGARHLQFESFSRTGAGLAGVQAQPLKVWVNNWQLTALQNEQLFPATLQALATDDKAGTVSVQLQLENLKPVVLQGDRGYSQKSATPGNASHYYSYTRLRARGELSIGGENHLVTGSAWLDREWSSSSLDSNQQGWDWFALQLDDHREIMFYRLRRRAGNTEVITDPYSRGVLVHADGTSTDLLPTDVKLQPRAYWRSTSGSRYPVEWRLLIPKYGIDLDVTATVEDQEWRQRFRYWEGAVDVSGSHSGRGYLEMTGY